MSGHPLGWSACLAVASGTLVLWFLYSAAQFHWGWKKLDPLCVDEPGRSFAFVVDDLYKPEAAERLRDVIASRYSDEAVTIDHDGAVLIRPALYYGYFLDLVRLGQLVVRPEDEQFLLQTPKLTCDEVRPYLRSEFNKEDLTPHRWPVTFYVFVVQPGYETKLRWENAYKADK
ncbi:MAG: hypothetical protein AAF563_07415 [Pseudomonadota bacterium]